jgi:hypothetical protein
MYSAPSRQSDTWSLHGIRISNGETFSISGTSSKEGMVLAFEGNDLVYFGGSIIKTHTDGTLTRPPIIGLLNSASKEILWA